MKMNVSEHLQAVLHNFKLVRYRQFLPIQEVVADLVSSKDTGVSAPDSRAVRCMLPLSP